MVKKDDPQYLILISRALKQRAEIAQYFIDVASWNDNSEARKNGADPIDPDPDGTMGRLARGLDAMLEREGYAGR